MIRSTRIWPRIIAHADMDAFYAAIEQLDDPALRGRPILVGSPSDRGIGLVAYDLVGSDDAQPGLFNSIGRRRQLEVAIDRLADRFDINVATRRGPW